MKRNKFLKVLAGIAIIPIAIVPVIPRVAAVPLSIRGFSQAEMEMFKRLIHGVRTPVWFIHEAR